MTIEKSLKDKSDNFFYHQKNLNSFVIIQIFKVKF